MDCPHKDITDLKFCTSCGVGDHSLEYCPTILDKFNKKNNVNALSCVQKNCFCDIFQEHGYHMTKDFPYNMKNDKDYWCAICEVKIHATTDYHLNLKN